MSETIKIEIRIIESIADFRRCVELQKAAFNLPDAELSPVRHLVVTTRAGGFVLGAFAGAEIVGFVHHLVAVEGSEIIGYSHMAAIAPAFQNHGIGAKLKWAQRHEALRRGQKFIKWTFDPMQSRNAYFNLVRLGAIAQSYEVNYYGTNYNTTLQNFDEQISLDSDRLFVGWQLDSPHVAALETGAAGVSFAGDLVRTIEIPADWNALVAANPQQARAEQLRVREEFQSAFANNLVCAGFERGVKSSNYLLYREKAASNFYESV
jgi:predicted GNAT superfamily acetyltransferase